MKKCPTQLRKVSLADRVIALIDGARQKVAYTANLAQVYTNYEIGRQIVEEEQGGKHRAGYGEKILIDLSAKLTARYGRGWSAETLRKMRAFFVMYSDFHNSVVDIQDSSDLSFYNRFTRSFFLIDLKLKNVGHDELGQMQTYVNYFDRKVKIPEENPTVGILLTSEKVDHALVEMFLPENEKNRIFVKQYTEVLPSKIALQRIVVEENRKWEKEQRLLALADVQTSAPKGKGCGK